ncbi:fructose transport system permease protein [Actinacidiphila yanglinensis]|uniref:Fructose transport system permease protein n=1 Tax=Actinacidiphila yanglinensis TaxID=310779 RepID=A0A1H6BWA4_9ACTN|nr:ABC transporter permease [Actinacidiphila yanglinensis]SEG64981.1 fructose transport system permease protein [Actinacidiphila yanglinensis]
MTTDVGSESTPQLAEDLLKRPAGPGQRVHAVLHRQPALSPAIVLILAGVAFTLLNSRFYHLQNLSLIAQQVAVVGSLAVGQTLVILTAGIDLSVGAVMVLSSLVMSKLVFDHGVPGVLALLAGAVLAVAAQTLNGLLVTRIKLPPFIVTLGTLSIFTAVTLIYAKGQTVSLQPGGFLLWSADTVSIGSLHLTNGVLLMIALYVVMGFALRYTAWGRHLYAVGDDAEAARLAGISVNRVLLSAYMVAGLAIAVAAWILVGRVGGGDPNSGLNANLESITAVVIGGTSLFGGRGAVVGSLIGAVIVQVFDNGLALAGFDPNYQVLSVGVLVIAAVSVDQWIRSVKA